MFSRLAVYGYCAALIGFLPVTGAAADSPAQPQGMWQGLIQQANSDVVMRLSFASTSVRAHFDEPFSCDVTARFLRADGDTLFYRFGPSMNGGRFCDGVMSRDLRVTPATTERAMTITFDTPRATWNGRLRPAPSP
ncbi:hypothetical protein KPL74_14665 [Bacillus sp. NP157]|nr:hypothetical protein KPL74_14665 [Bacillus sp. NP157]